MKTKQQEVNYKMKLEKLTQGLKVEVEFKEQLIKLNLKQIKNSIERGTIMDIFNKGCISEEQKEKLLFENESKSQTYNSIRTEIVNKAIEKGVHKSKLADC